MRNQAHNYLSGSQHETDTANIDSKSVHTGLFQCISESSLPAHEKDEKRLAHEGVVIISAGGETTSRVLTIAVFHIWSNPSILRQLQEEVMTIMPETSKIPSVKALEELPYLVSSSPG